MTSQMLPLLIAIPFIAGVLICAFGRKIPLFAANAGILVAAFVLLCSICLVTEVSRPDSWTHYSLSAEVLAPLDNLQKGLRRRLFQVQYRHEAAIPIWLERDIVTLVEQWALGVEWLELISHTSLDEGDVVRILRRTLDFLSQIPHVPHVSDSLRRNACRAMQLIDRFPVNEAAS